MNEDSFLRRRTTTSVPVAKMIKISPQPNSLRVLLTTPVTQETRGPQNRDKSTTIMATRIKYRAGDSTRKRSNCSHHVLLLFLPLDLPLVLDFPLAISPRKEVDELCPSFLHLYLFILGLPCYFGLSNSEPPASLLDIVYYVNASTGSGDSQFTIDSTQSYSSSHYTLL